MLASCFNADSGDYSFSIYFAKTHPKGTDQAGYAHSAGAQINHALSFPNMPNSSSL
jgi:hypothetical protein